MGYRKHIVTQLKANSTMISVTEWLEQEAFNHAVPDLVWWIGSSTYPSFMMMLNVRNWSLVARNQEALLTHLPTNCEFPFLRNDSLTQRIEL